VGFVSGMQGWSNSQKSNNLIHHINRLKGKNYISKSIDVEKAFDKTICKLIIEGNLLTLMKNIYKKNYN
jgi:hypothetical protein